MKATQDVDVWIGLSDSGSSGKFHWTDGSNLDYTNWGPGQPDGVLFPGEVREGIHLKKINWDCLYFII